MNSWSELEVETIISNYFEMLSSELLNRAYSKSEYRRKLLPLLNNRTEGSIEFKHQNISAILINLGQPYIKGYLPRYNYQKILEDKVIDYLIRNQSIESQFKSFADKDISPSASKVNFDKVLVEAPKSNIALEPYSFYGKSPIKTNYLEREQKNSKLGFLGEEFVLEFEKWNLIKCGKEDLAKYVRWVSQEEGDGLGFDILSRNPNGTDKYIEVKTTKLGKETPFYFTRNELTFSINNSQNFHLYRLFDFEANAKLFLKNGSFETICRSVPITYKGFF